LDKLCLDSCAAKFEHRQMALTMYKIYFAVLYVDTEDEQLFDMLAHFAELLSLLFNFVSKGLFLVFIHPKHVLSICPDLLKMLRASLVGLIVHPVLLFFG
jgi:hypothetical protein